MKTLLAVLAVMVSSTAMAQAPKWKTVFTDTWEDGTCKLQVNVSSIQRLDSDRYAFIDKWICTPPPGKDKFGLSAPAPYPRGVKDASEGTDRVSCSFWRLTKDGPGPHDDGFPAYVALGSFLCG